MDIHQVKADARAVSEAIDAVPTIINDFCNVSGVSATRLGYLSVGDPNMYRRMRTRGRAQANTIQKVLKWIIAWQPEAAH